jgi:hypothetical protein
LKFDMYYNAISVNDVAPIVRRWGDMGLKDGGIFRVPRDMVFPVQQELKRLRCTSIKVIPNDMATSKTPDDYLGRAREARKDIDARNREKKLIEQEEKLRRAR